MQDNDFLKQLAQAEVVTRGNYLKAGKGICVVKGIKRDDTRDGEAAILDVLVLKVTPKDNQPANTVGEVATKMYMFEKGTIDKKAATFANFKRDMCAIDGSDPKAVNNEKLTQIAKFGAPRAEKGKPLTPSIYVGMLIGFDSYDGRTKDGQPRTYHNFTTIQQTEADVKKRAQLLATGADASKFL